MIVSLPLSACPIQDLIWVAPETDTQVGSWTIIRGTAIPRLFCIDVYFVAFCLPLIWIAVTCLRSVVGFTQKKMFHMFHSPRRNHRWRGAHHVNCEIIPLRISSWRWERSSPSGKFAHRFRRTHPWLKGYSFPQCLGRKTLVQWICIIDGSSFWVFRVWNPCIFGRIPRELDCRGVGESRVFVLPGSKNVRSPMFLSSKVWSQVHFVFLIH